MVIRKAVTADLDAVEAIYDQLHTLEEKKVIRTGWIRHVYPTRATAEAAMAPGTLYVLEDEGVVRASAKIDQEQPESYFRASWTLPAEADAVLVLHTLVVDPTLARIGYGKAFVGFYEQEAARRGCTVLRIDTNETNTPARRLYASLGYREVGAVPCEFNGIPNVNLVCLEKAVQA